MIDNKELILQIEEAANFLRKRLGKSPSLALILGTGLDIITENLQVLKEVPFKLIPYMMPTTVESHPGRLIMAEWKGKAILLVCGRLHYYEGYNMQEVTFLVRVLKWYGITSLWISNASGAVNPDFKTGDIVFIHDHINFHSENPLRGIRDERLGTRFPDMSDVYDKAYLELARDACYKTGIPFLSGIYFGLQGPNLETPAEYRMIRLLGADLVGMSTVPEVIVAHQCNLRIMAVAIVSNSSPQYSQQEKTTLESVIAAVQAASKKLFTVLDAMIDIL